MEAKTGISERPGNFIRKSGHMMLPNSKDCHQLHSLNVMEVYQRWEENF